FSDQAGVALNTVIESNTITVTGINYPTFIEISSCSTGANCQYKINAGAWTSSYGTVQNNDTVTVRLTSSPNPLTSRNLLLRIGGILDTFTVTTGTGGTQNTITVSKTGTGTVTSIPSGINCGSTCNFSFATGSKVTLLFSPTPSWIQVGGNPSIGGTNALTIRELNADTTVTVNFP
ncbi:MAG: hypothetical protein N3A62_02035, partial [Thermodesulfovibrionales bacterium]|nr:hypothetical protein [Thermodesulfovibrionales bacterium]